MLKDNKKPVIIVLSRNYSTGLGVVRSLGAAGYTIDLIASVKKRGSSVIASCSKYVRRSIEVQTEKIQGDSGEAVLKVLLDYARNSTEKKVLFPTDDFTASIVFDNRNLLNMHFLLPGIKAEFEDAVTDITNKAVQSRMAANAGFSVPKEWYISLDNEIVIPEEMMYPCFVKPLQSVAGSKMEMKACADRYTLEEHLFKMKKNYENRTVLVQQFLKIDKEYDLSGICLDQEIVIPGIIEKQRIARYENGVTMVGKMIPVDALGEIKEKLKILMQQFHYEGMFDLELIQSGGKIYFNEINFRSGGPNYFYYLNGANLPEYFVRGITGEKEAVKVPEIKEYGRTFVYEKVAWEDYIHGYMKKAQLKQCLSDADYTLLADRDDPKPGQYFNRRIRLSAIKQRVKKLIGK